MDHILANMFNTHGYAEKTAQDEYNVEQLLKVAEEEGVDLSELDDEEIVELANELAEETSEVGGEGEDGYDPDYYEGADNMGPKTAEAEFLGRYMAHAMHDEQEKIAKASGAFRKALDSAKGHAGRYKELLTGSKAKKMETAISGRRAAAERIGRSGKASPALKAKADKAAKGIKGMQGKMSDEKRKVLMARLGTGAAAAGGVGAAAAAMNKKSHVEALNESAVEYANHLLGLANDGQEITFNKVASVQETYEDQLIAELAWGMLQENGYVE